MKFDRYLLVDGPAVGRIGDAEGADTIRVPVSQRYDHFAHEYQRTDEPTAAEWGLATFAYVGYTVASDSLFRPNAADARQAALQVSWDEQVQPVLDELGITIESEAAGYEVDGHAALACTDGTYIVLYQEGWM